jgi:hypothetical protein
MLAPARRGETVTPREMAIRAVQIGCDPDEGRDMIMAVEDAIRAARRAALEEAAKKARNVASEHRMRANLSATQIAYERNVERAVEAEEIAVAIEALAERGEA